MLRTSLRNSPATIRRHYAKWTPEYQARHDRVTRIVHGTNLGTGGRIGQQVLITKGLLWWPRTESNCRRQPFQGWTGLGLQPSFERYKPPPVSRKRPFDWDSNGTRFWPVELAFNPASPPPLPEKFSATDCACPVRYADLQEKDDSFHPQRV